MQISRGFTGFKLTPLVSNAKKRVEKSRATRGVAPKVRRSQTPHDAGSKRMDRVAELRSFASCEVDPGSVDDDAEDEESIELPELYLQVLRHSRRQRLGERAARTLEKIR